MTTLLIGGYRATDLNDPQIFTRIIAATFAQYPAQIGLEAADELTRTSEWLPTRAELIEVCERLMEDRRYAEHKVRAHLEQHDENERRREARKRWLAKRAEHYDENPDHRIFDRWWPLFPAYREDSRWEWKIKRMIEEFGEQRVDAWHQQILNGPTPPMNDRDTQAAFWLLISEARKAHDAQMQGPKPHDADRGAAMTATRTP